MRHRLSRQNPLAERYYPRGIKYPCTGGPPCPPRLCWLGAIFLQPFSWEFFGGVFRGVPITVIRRVECRLGPSSESPRKRGPMRRSPPASVLLALLSAIAPGFVGSLQS